MKKKKGKTEKQGKGDWGEITNCNVVTWMRS